MSEHRVLPLRSSLRRREDPENSRDPRVRQLVEALQALDYAPAPSPRFRDELRAQLVAVAPRIIAESTPDTAAADSSEKRSAVPRAEPAQRRRFVRPLAVASGVAAVLLMIFGGAVWMSQKALPGDSLYGLKRASENVQLALSSGGTDRGHEYLSLAQTRVEEAQALLRRNSASASGAGTLAGALSSHTADLIASNLASADSDLRHGSDLLTTQAVTSDSQSPISVITGWAPGQLDRLHALATSLPQGSLQQRTQSSWTLTNSALTRARTLAPAVASGCASTTKADPLGPVPTCAGTPSHGSTTPHTSPATSTPSSHTNSTGGAGVGVGGTGSTTPNPRTSTHARTGHSTPTPSSSPSHRSLPSLLPSKGPISVGSCGLSVSLGPVGIGVGGCPSHS